MIFPEKLVPDANGRVFVGGVLDVPTILEAYRRGLFPWRGGTDIPWYSPDPRAILVPAQFHASSSLDKRRRSGRYRVELDRDTLGAQRRCSTTTRAYQGTAETWITPDMMAVYEELVALGIAHSVETYVDDEPVGGLYGLAFGRVFHGESMYFTSPDASKLALWALAERLAERGFAAIDCQVMTPHLRTIGAQAWTRARYLALLDANRDVPSAW